MEKCYKGNLYGIKKGKGKELQILSKTKETAVRKFNEYFASKGKGKIKVRTIKKDMTFCK